MVTTFKYQTAALTLNTMLTYTVYISTTGTTGQGGSNLLAEGATIVLEEYL